MFAPLPQAEEVQLSGEVAAVQRRVHEALCDNVNTRAAMDALGDLIKAVNVYLAKKDAAPGEKLCWLVGRGVSKVW